MCTYVCVCVCLRVLIGLPASVCERQRVEKVGDRGGKKNIEQKKDKTIHFTSCLRAFPPVCGRPRVFIVMFRSSSSNSAPFCSQVHVCQRLLLSLSSLNVLDQISLSLYLLFYFKFISFFFFKCVLFSSLIESDSHHQSCPMLFVKGVGPGYYVAARAGFQQKFLKSLCFIETSVWLFWSFLLLFCYLHLYGGKKTILHDPTVFPELLYIPIVNTLWLYSTVPPIYYWQLHGTVCLSKTTHTHTHSQNPF